MQIICIDTLWKIIKVEIIQYYPNVLKFAVNIKPNQKAFHRK